MPAWWTSMSNMKWSRQEWYGGFCSFAGKCGRALTGLVELRDGFGRLIGSNVINRGPCKHWPIHSLRNPNHQFAMFSSNSHRQLVSIGIWPLTVGKVGQTGLSLFVHLVCLRTAFTTQCVSTPLSMILAWEEMLKARLHFRKVCTTYEVRSILYEAFFWRS